MSGRVQGVFFRDTCARRARGAGVAGWVRNRPDGAVEAWFEGRPGPVEAMVAWCGVGPGQARVDRVVVEAVRPAGLETFRIQ